MAEDKKKKSTQIGAGLALGVGAGLAVGNAVGNVEVGLAIGIAIGLSGGAYWNRIDQWRATNRTNNVVFAGVIVLAVALIVGLMIYF